MKKTHKNIFYSIGAFTIAMGILALSCNMNKTSGSMAFAQESQSQTQSAQTKPIPTDSLAVTQSLQNTFRSISSNVLPSVVEIDVTETIFTESLAKIYIKQKQYDKAKRIFERLNLKFPEKSSYFADQIKNIDKLITNN